MQHLKNFDWKKFLLQGVLPCLLAVAVGFISRYQLELSDGVTESFLQLQWPLYAPLNALTAFCLTLILFALLGKWSRATGISGAVFTIIALINYYTRDLHGSALMPQDILNLGTAAEVMGSYTLKITQDVVKIALLYLPILAIAFVQARLVKGAPKRASWKARGVRAAGSALGVFLVMFFGYFGPVTIKPKTTYGWAWQNTYYTYGYLAGTIEATSLMADPVIEPENYNDAAAVNTAHGGGNGGGLAGGVARDHAGSAVFAQCPGKGQHRARQNALTAGGHPHPPEDPCIGLSQRLRRPRQRFVKAFKRAARGAVHQRKSHHDGGKDGAVPVHDQLYPELLHEKNAQRPLCAEEQQQKVANHRGRQHHRQGEQHIQHTLDHPGQPGNIIGRKNAKKEHRRAAD